MVSKPDVENLQRAAVLSVARKIALSAGATKTTPVQQPPAQNPTRSIFKAKTSTPQPVSAPAEGQAPTSTRPHVAGNQALTPTRSAQQPAAPQKVGTSSDRIQIPASNGRISLNPT